ncbi:DUF1778 domain-containing protein [Leclercia adecarboxylata ATCC 23216 = NBRC 102595]|nr:DUF1778 domain-containing protein [Leclercia adecarboxylata ATCC 23216 = NBRC 102595]
MKQKLIRRNKQRLSQRLRIKFDRETALIASLKPQRINLDPDQFEAFLELLDMPLSENEGYQRLMRCGEN